MGKKKYDGQVEEPQKKKSNLTETTEESVNKQERNEHFDVKHFRKQLTKREGQAVALTQFLQACLSPDKKRDYMLEYLNTGGGALEVVRLAGDDTPSADTALQLFALAVRCVKEQAPHRLDDTEQACRHLLRSPTLLTALSAEPRRRRHALEALAAAADMGPALAAAVLQLTPLSAERLRRATPAERPALLRLIAALLRESDPRSLLRRRGLVTLPLAGLARDPPGPALEYLTALDATLVKDTALSKTLKLSAFGHRALSDALTALAWRGPPGITIAERDAAKPELQRIICDSLLTLFTCRKLGLYFADEAATNSDAGRNPVLRRALLSQRKPWEDERAPLLLDIVARRPELQGALVAVAERAIRTGAGTPAEDFLSKLTPTSDRLAEIAGALLPSRAAALVRGVTLPVPLLECARLHLETPATAARGAELITGALRVATNTRRALLEGGKHAIVTELDNRLSSFLPRHLPVSTLAVAGEASLDAMLLYAELRPSSLEAVEWSPDLMGPKSDTLKLLRLRIAIDGCIPPPTSPDFRSALSVSWRAYMSGEVASERVLVALVSAARVCDSDEMDVLLYATRPGSHTPIGINEALADLVIRARELLGEGRERLEDVTRLLDRLSESNFGAEPPLYSHDTSALLAASKVEPGLEDFSAIYSELLQRHTGSSFSKNEDYVSSLQLPLSPPESDLQARVLTRQILYEALTLAHRGELDKTRIDQLFNALRTTLTRDRNKALAGALSGSLVKSSFVPQAIDKANTATTDFLLTVFEEFTPDETTLKPYRQLTALSVTAKLIGDLKRLKRALKVIGTPDNEDAKLVTFASKADTELSKIIMEALFVKYSRDLERDFAEEVIKTAICIGTDIVPGPLADYLAARPEHSRLIPLGIVERVLKNKSSADEIRVAKFALRFGADVAKHGAEILSNSEVWNLKNGSLPLASALLEKPALFSRIVPAAKSICLPLVVMLAKNPEEANVHAEYSDFLCRLTLECLGTEDCATIFEVPIEIENFNVTHTRILRAAFLRTLKSPETRRREYLVSYVHAIIRCLKSALATAKDSDIISFSNDAADALSSAEDARLFRSGIPELVEDLLWKDCWKAVLDKALSVECDSEAAAALLSLLANLVRHTWRPGGGAEEIMDAIECHPRSAKALSSTSNPLRCKLSELLYVSSRRDSRPPPSGLTKLVLDSYGGTQGEGDRVLLALLRRLEGRGAEIDAAAWRGGGIRALDPGLMEQTARKFPTELQWDYRFRGVAVKDGHLYDPLWVFPLALSSAESAGRGRERRLAALGVAALGAACGRVRAAGAATLGRALTLLRGDGKRKSDWIVMRVLTALLRRSIGDPNSSTNITGELRGSIPALSGPTAQYLSRGLLAAAAPKDPMFTPILHYLASTERFSPNSVPDFPSLLHTKEPSANARRLRVSGMLADASRTSHDTAASLRALCPKLLSDLAQSRLSDNNARRRHLDAIVAFASEPRAAASLLKGHSLAAFLRTASNPKLVSKVARAGIANKVRKHTDVLASNALLSLAARGISGWVSALKELRDVPKVLVLRATRCVKGARGKALRRAVLTKDDAPLYSTLAPPPVDKMFEDEENIEDEEKTARDVEFIVRNYLDRVRLVRATI